MEILIFASRRELGGDRLIPEIWKNRWSFGAGSSSDYLRISSRIVCKGVDEIILEIPEGNTRRCFEILKEFNFFRLPTSRNDPPTFVDKTKSERWMAIILQHSAPHVSEVGYQKIAQQIYDGDVAPTTP